MKAPVLATILARMTTARRLVAEIVVDDQALSGVVTDEAGRRWSFQGWLELIGLLQRADDGGDGEPPPSRGAQ